MSALNIEVISAQGIIFKGECHTAMVPSVDGDMGIMNNHESVMAKLKEGKLVLEDDKKNPIKELDVSSGYAEMCDNKLIVLLD